MNTNPPENFNNRWPSVPASNSICCLQSGIGRPHSRTFGILTRLENRDSPAIAGECGSPMPLSICFNGERSRRGLAPASRAACSSQNHRAPGRGSERRQTGRWPSLGPGFRTAAKGRRPMPAPPAEHKQTSRDRKQTRSQRASAWLGKISSRRPKPSEKRSHETSLPCLRPPAAEHSQSHSPGGISFELDSFGASGSRKAVQTQQR